MVTPHSYGGGASEHSFSYDQLFGITTIDSKLHKLHFIDCNKLSTYFFYFFIAHKIISRVVVIDILFHFLLDYLTAMKHDLL